MWSKQTDRPGAPDNTQKFKAVAGPGLILYGFTISFAAIDWVMSLDPSWISTIFGLIILIGEVLSAMCFAVVVERILVQLQAHVGDAEARLRPRPRQVDAHLHHGLGLLQLLAVADHLGGQSSHRDHVLHRAPELRLGQGRPLPRIFHFAVPFAILLSRPFKRNIRKLVWLAIWLILMRWVDLFWIIEPNFSKALRRHHRRHRRARCDRRLLAGVLLPQSGCAAAAAGL